MRITVDFIIRIACEGYTREIVEDLFDGRKYVYPITVAKSGIPAEDILWVLLREEFFTAEELLDLARKFAEHVARLNNYHSKAAARDAWEAAWSARAAREAAAWGGAWAAARRAALAALAAAREAAREAAYEKERRWQLEQVIAKLEEK